MTGQLITDHPNFQNRAVMVVGDGFECWPDIDTPDARLIHAKGPITWGDLIGGLTEGNRKQRRANWAKLRKP